MLKKALMIGLLRLNQWPKCAWTERYSLAFIIIPPMFQILLYVLTSNASVNSSIAHPPPPGKPRAFVTFSLPGGRALVLAKLSRGGELFTGRAFVSTGRFCDKHVLLRSLSFTKFSLNVFVSYIFLCRKN